MSKLEKVTTEFLTLLAYIRDEYLKPADQITRSRLSPAQFHAIAILCHTGALPMSELAGELKISKQQLTPVIAKLIETQQVIRKTDAHDRRIVQIEITTAGRKTFETLGAEIKRNFTQKLSLIPEADLEELARMLTRMQEILYHSQ
jgi:DNA-binding MarR family transcriptional regulator